MLFEAEEQNWEQLGEELNKATLNNDDLESVAKLIKGKLNWSTIHSYRFGYYKNITFNQYLRWISIEGFKEELNLKRSVEELSTIDTLNLSNKHLTEVPKELGSLTSLKKLYLSNNNKLTEVPKEIGLLTSLQILDLSYNQLTSVPEELGALISLERLYLFNNQLTSIPKEIGLLTSLQILYLSSNR